MPMSISGWYSLRTAFLIPALGLTLFSSAFAISDPALHEDTLDLPVSSSPGSPVGLQGNTSVDSMFQPVPSSLDKFELSASGMSLTKREGRDGPFTDAELALRGSVTQDEGDYLRFRATGSVTIGNSQTFDILDAEGTVIFFKHPRGDSIVGLMHIAGIKVQDGAGTDLKFKVRAHILDHPDDNAWRVVISPAGKLGDVMLVNFDGVIRGVQT